jgi:hypothetical protein
MFRRTVLAWKYYHNALCANQWNPNQRRDCGNQDILERWLQKAATWMQGNLEPNVDGQAQKAALGC